MASVELSVILPVLDEVDSLDLLYRELTTVLQSLGRPYELIFVDDGSRDGSFTRIEKLHRSDDRVRAIQLRRNFGKAAALAVGFGANLYLTGLWLAGVRPIGTRPLLAFGVLSMLVGIQFFAVGLLSELVLSYQTKSADDVSVRCRLG